MGQTSASDGARVYLLRGTRRTLARLDGPRRAALLTGLLRAGQELLASAERLEVATDWARGTWPRRRYPQQCYAKTLTYVLGHPEIAELRLVHGVASHAPWFVPFDHAWVELPGGAVFDGVVQAFFTRESYVAVMAAMPLDVYTRPRAERLSVMHGHPGPWNTKWVPTPTQVAAYVARRRLALGLR